MDVDWPEFWLRVNKELATLRASLARAEAERDEALRMARLLREELAQLRIVISLASEPKETT